MANTIKLKKYSDVVKEKVAASAITPGMLITLDTNGKVTAHASAEQAAVPMFALEDELQGNGIDDAYAAGDPVQCWYPARGDEVYAILTDGENASIGDNLVSAGDGGLQVFAAGSAGEVEYPNCIVARALEAVDLSGSSGEESSGALGYDKRIIVEIV
jgi:hypothetical protein